MCYGLIELRKTVILTFSEIEIIGSGSRKFAATKACKLNL
jgi:hypothetical protein